MWRSSRGERVGPEPISELRERVEIVPVGFAR